MSPIAAAHEAGGAPTSRSPVPLFDVARCTLCGCCLTACPSGAIELWVEPGRTTPAAVSIDGATCTYCGACEDACPELAIELPYEIVLEGAPTR